MDDAKVRELAANVGALMKLHQQRTQALTELLALCLKHLESPLQTRAMQAQRRTLIAALRDYLTSHKGAST